MGEKIWYCSFCSKKLYNPPPPSDASNLIFIPNCHYPLLFLHFRLSVISQITAQGVLLSHQHFSSITSTQSHKEHRERHNCDRSEFPNRPICNLPSFTQAVTWVGLTWPWHWAQPWFWPFQNKKYIPFGAASGTYWPLNFCSAAIFGEAMRSKPKAGLNHWPDFCRGHQLTRHLMFGYHSLHLVTDDTFVFPAQL